MSGRLQPKSGRIVRVRRDLASLGWVVAQCARVVTRLPICTREVIGTYGDARGVRLSFRFVSGTDTKVHRACTRALQTFRADGCTCACMGVCVCNLACISRSGRTHARTRTCTCMHACAARVRTRAVVQGQDGIQGPRPRLRALSLSVPARLHACVHTQVFFCVFFCEMHTRMNA